MIQDEEATLQYFDDGWQDVPVVDQNGDDIMFNENWN
jgi:hypothetical protein